MRTKGYLYNIHEILNVMSNTKIDVISEYFLKSYSDLASSHNKKIKTLFIEVSKIPSTRFNGYYTNSRENLVGIRFKKGPIDIFFELKDLEKNETYFRISPWILRIPLLKQRFTDTLLHIMNIKLIQNGYAMIHAAAGVYKDKGYILGGGFGAGKSLSTFFFIKNSSTYFSDDIIITNKNGIMFSYPLKIALYPYHFRICKWLKKPNWHGMFKIYLRAIFHTLIPLQSGIQIVDPFIGEKEIFEVFPDIKIGTSHKIDYLFLLETIGEKKYELKKINNKEIFFEQFFLTNKKVFNYEYNPLILSYSYFYPKCLLLTKIVEEEKKIIKSIVEKSSLFISRAWGELHANQIMKFIENDMHE